MESTSSPFHGDDRLRALLTAQWRRYPRMELPDLYKLLHQGVLGSEHAVTSESAAREWLEREIAGLGPGPAEPRLDPISHDGRIVRVHLRPFLAAGGNPALLLRAFVRTANEHRGSTAEFQAAWRLAESLVAGHDAACDRGPAGARPGHGAGCGPVLPFPREAMAAYFAPLAAAGCPAVHHSPAYEKAYAPAYRVVRVEFME